MNDNQGTNETDSTPPPAYSDTTVAGDGKPKDSWLKRAWKKTKKVLDEYGLTPAHVRFWGVLFTAVGAATHNKELTRTAVLIAISGEISAAKRGESAVKKLLRKVKKEP